MSSAATVAAAQAARRRALLAHFRAHEATVPERAIADDALPHATSMALKRFRAQDVVRATPGGLLYLDEPRLRETDATRRATIIKILAFVALAALAVVAVAALHALA